MVVLDNILTSAILLVEEISHFVVRELIRIYQ